MRENEEIVGPPIDRLLDMARTVPNVTGDLTCACFIARTEAVKPVAFVPAAVAAEATTAGSILPAAIEGRAE